MTNGKRRASRMSDGYDEKCGELADYFLPQNTEAAKDLAQAIQDAIEEWLQDYVGITERK